MSRINLYAPTGDHRHYGADGLLCAAVCQSAAIRCDFHSSGAADDLGNPGRSPLMVEMMEADRAIRQAASVRSFSLMSWAKLGRRLMMEDGAETRLLSRAHSSLCWAKTLFATHYHELTALEDSLGIWKMSMATEKGRTE